MNNSKYKLVIFETNISDGIMSPNKKFYPKDYTDKRLQQANNEKTSLVSQLSQLQEECSSQRAQLKELKKNESKLKRMVSESERVRREACEQSAAKDEQIQTLEQKRACYCSQNLNCGGTWTTLAGRAVCTVRRCGHANTYSEKLGNVQLRRLRGGGAYAENRKPEPDTGTCSRKQNP